MRKFSPIGIIIAALIITINQLTPHALRFISPLSTQGVSALGQARVKLERGENTYSLKNPTSSFITASYAGAPYDNASSYAVIDYESGEVLAEKDLSHKVPIASLTKILTAITALDLTSPDEEFTATERAAKVIPTKIAVIPGEKFTLRELLNASLLTSANDATEVIRDGVDSKYGADIFVKSMNIKAKFIGLKNSHFENPQGFDDQNHYSTAEDLAVLSHYALTYYPVIADIVKKNEQYIPETKNHRRFVLYNWNGLVGVYPNVYGMKIGNTDDAGMTTIVVSERQGKKILAVVLGAPGVLERDLWASHLLDLGFEKSAGLSAIGITPSQLRAKYATWVPWN